MVEFGEHDHRLGDQVLVRGAMAEVGADRRIHRVDARGERSPQPLQVGAALRDVGPPRLPGIAQALQRGLQFVQGRVGGGIHTPQCSRALA